MNIALIGAGNVATHLGRALKENGHTIVQVFSRTEASASSLADKLNAHYTTTPQEIIDHADLYLFSIKDDAIALVLDAMNTGNGLYVHTAGSVPLEIFQGKAQRYGVLYPLQTFSKAREVSFQEIPLLVEAANEADTTLLLEVAESLSGTVRLISSEQRKHLHLSAVFACNFVNHLYTISMEISDKAGVDPSLLLPMLKETVAKIETLSPAQAQTGPAVRNDRHVMEKHLALIEKEKTREIYRLLSQSIHEYAVEINKTILSL